MDPSRGLSGCTRRMTSSVALAQACLDGEDIGMPASDLIEDMMHEIIRLEHEVAAERDACAAICEGLIIPGHSVQEPWMLRAANLIRKRGKS